MKWGLTAWSGCLPSACSRKQLQKAFAANEADRLYFDMSNFPLIWRLGIQDLGLHVYMSSMPHEIDKPEQPLPAF